MSPTPALGMLGLLFRGLEWGEGRELGAHHFCGTPLCHVGALDPF